MRAKPHPMAASNPRLRAQTSSTSSGRAAVIVGVAEDPDPAKVGRHEVPEVIGAPVVHGAMINPALEAAGMASSSPPRAIKCQP